MKLLERDDLWDGIATISSLRWPSLLNRSRAHQIRKCQLSSIKALPFQMIRFTCPESGSGNSSSSRKSRRHSHNTARSCWRDMTVPPPNTIFNILFRYSRRGGKWCPLIVAVLFLEPCRHLVLLRCVVDLLERVIHTGGGNILIKDKTLRQYRQPKFNYP